MDSGKEVKINREAFYALIRRQTEHWLLIDKGKAQDDEDNKIKPYRPKNKIKTEKFKGRSI